MRELQGKICKISPGLGDAALLLYRNHLREVHVNQFAGNFDFIKIHLCAHNIRKPREAPNRQQEREPHSLFLLFSSCQFSGLFWQINYAKSRFRPFSFATDDEI
jgi:hypothetical protein